MDRRRGSHHRRDDRQPITARDAKPEQDDVPGHVGGEHAPEGEIADGVDESGGEGQAQQRPGEGGASRS